MSLEFNNKNTKVQQLTDFIQKSIVSHELNIGDKLPSINQLSQQFHLSRDTVFKAFTLLKEKGVIDSVHGKNYYVASRDKKIFLLLDEYTPFKEVLYNRLRRNLPDGYDIDLWFHQYNEQLFDQIIGNAAGMFDRYLVMNYHNERMSESLAKIDKKKLLLLDFGKFNKNGYSYVCQDFDYALYYALRTIKSRIAKYKMFYFVFNKNHKHPRSSKDFFGKFCRENDVPYEIIEEFTDEMEVTANAFYLVIKQEDVVKIIKKGKQQQFKTGRDYGLLAYNENPLYEVIENGIASIGIDWKKVGDLAVDFITRDKVTQLYLPTEITIRKSL